MLTAEDVPTIEWALRRRLDKEPGAWMFIPIVTQAYAKGDLYQPNPDVDLWARAGEPFIRVGVLIELGKSILLRAKFDLPDPFEHGHLLNECDQIAEQCKRARKEFWLSGMDVRERKVPGTGMRGNWDRYGTLLGRHG